MIATPDKRLLCSHFFATFGLDFLPTFEKWEWGAFATQISTVW
ncbi:hypothetical protein [Breoghania sp. JC706]